MSKTSPPREIFIVQTLSGVARLSATPFFAEAQLAPVLTGIFASSPVHCEA